LTQAELAARLTASRSSSSAGGPIARVEQPHVSRWERGVVTPTGDSLARLCQHVDYFDLLDVAAARRP
jgi:transcriptional regulator with XRE-family HTH domain